MRNNDNQGERIANQKADNIIEEALVMKEAVDLGKIAGVPVVIQEEAPVQEENNVALTYTDPVTGKFVPGNPGGGRPPGSKNYTTLYKEALVKLAKENDKEPDDIEVEMIANALLRARKGDFNFYRDVMDRMHGKAAQAIEISQKDNKVHLTPEQMEDLNRILNEYRANR